MTYLKSPTRGSGERRQAAHLLAGMGIIHRAQENEADEFLVILRKLVDTLEQPPQEPGRRACPVDMVFAVSAKVYGTMSTPAGNVQHPQGR